MRVRPSLATLDVALMVLGLALVAALPAYLLGDGALRYDDLQELVGGSIPHQRYSLIAPLVSLPLYPLGALTGTDPSLWVVRLNLLVAAGGLLALWFTLRDLLPPETLRSFLLVFLTCSLVGHEIEAYGAELLTTLLVGLGAVLVAAQRRGRLGWAAVIIGVANIPASLVGMGLMTVVWSFVRRRWRYVLLGLVAFGLIETELLVRNGTLVSNYVDDRGTPTVLPYSGRSGFSYPFFLGLISIVLSFGKGLVWFAPGLLLPVRRTLRRLAEPLERVYLLWAAFLIGLVLLYSKWWGWYGGFSWGPRFFVFASLPASLAVAVALRHGRSPWLRLAALGVLVLAAWVGLNGVVFAQSRLQLGQPDCTRALEHLCWYVPEFSVLWHPFVRNVPLDLRSLAYIVYAVGVLIRLAAPSVPELWRWAVGGLGRLRVEQLSRPDWRF